MHMINLTPINKLVLGDITISILSHIEDFTQLPRERRKRGNPPVSCPAFDAAHDLLCFLRMGGKCRGWGTSPPHSLLQLTPKASRDLGLLQDWSLNESALPC